jgi:hypothetical protein
MKRTAIPAVALVSIGVLALPATGYAFKFGAKLDREPDNSAPPHKCFEDAGNGGLTSPCTRALVSSETGLAGGHLTSPSNGVITKFRIRAGAAGAIRFKLVRIKDLDLSQGGAGKGKARAKSKKFTVQGNGFNDSQQIESFSVHLSVKKGDYIAIDGSETSAERCTSGSTRQLMWAPPLKIGDPFRANDDGADCTLMVQAIGHTT